ncbi:MAG: TetR/AcrR family transcriptional regulator [Acidimicrobiales bacterium]
MAPGVSPRRDRYAAQTRAAIIRAARRQFAAGGFPSTSIDDVANTAKVSKGAVYHHFEDKQALFEAVFRESQIAVMQTVREQSSTQASPGGRVEAGIRGMFLAYDQPAARALLLQAPAALGVDRVRALDQELSLPMVQATIESFANPRPAVPALAARLLFVALCEVATAAAEGTVTSEEAIQTVLCIARGLGLPTETAGPRKAN